MIYHDPVLLNESINYLMIQKSGVYFDGTLGFGGHASELLRILDNDSIFIATDKDAKAYLHCKNKFAEDSRVKLYNTSYTNINVISKIEDVKQFDGIFADLGVSSFQLDDVESGFTYRSDAELDLRMNKKEGVPAWKVLNTLEKNEIANIIYEYGEERKSRQIADKIVEFRKQKKLTRTSELKSIIEKVIPQRFLMNSLSRVFQALRIYVNNELSELKIFIDKSIQLLKPGGRIVILTYHSLEDRIVKEKFKYAASDCICPPESPVCNCDKESEVKILTKKPVLPSEDEVKRNSRSRSAKLRAAEKI